MLNPMLQAKQAAAALVGAAVEQAQREGALPAGPVPAFAVEVPGDAAHGDLAANIALAGARAFRMAPRAIAQQIVQRLAVEGSIFARAEIAGPGFINLFLSDQWFAQVVAGIVREGTSYGRSEEGQGEKVMVEFVSANPTGPMHMGNARGGAIGDGLAACLEWAGYQVTREFYINDAGNQIENFGKSLYARYLQHFLGEEAVPFPEDGYHGEDIRRRAEEFIAQVGDRYLHADPEQAKQALVAYALPENIRGLREDLARYRISFDVWFKESTLHESGAVQAAIDRLAARGLTYEKDGALWYKASQFGGEKDEVLVRGNGIPTYFAADIAYHINKFEQRGFARVINVWGADHHGHVARLKGAMDAAGLDGSRLDVVIMQLVRLTKGGEPVRMSKRTGKSVTLNDLLEEVPVDAARFFFNMREPGSPLDFDLDLAVEQTAQNPVYYVQYAHARICSILKNLAAEGIGVRTCPPGELCILTQPEERALISVLGRFTDEIISAAKNYDPARITHYLQEVATAFHRFYTTCRCRCEDGALMQARLNLCMATRVVLRNALALLKIDAPEVM